MGQLDEQVTVVLGADEPLKRGVADAYAREGACVVVGGAGASALDDAVREHGRLDVMFIAPRAPHADGPAAAMSDEHWQRVLDRSLNEVFRSFRRAIQHMLPRRRGRIVVASGVEAKLPRAESSAHVAAMHGVAGLVKSVAREVGTHGIAVNAILAGPLDGGSEAESKLGRHVTVEEVTRVAVLLASPHLTSITGCMFPVDGGATPY